jgi:hypothetical protein
VNFPKRWVSFLLIFLFMSTALHSLKRFPMVVLPFTVIGYFLIKNKFGTVFAYVGAISSLVLLIAFSETLAQKLPDWEDDIENLVDRRDSTQKHLFQLRTLNTRLEDFAYLKRAENWEPFGVHWFKKYDAGDYGVHSLLVKIFLRFGWVPISIGMLLFVIPLAGFVHSRLLKRRSDLQHRTFVYCVSLNISIFLAAALGASFIGSFPIPVLFGMFLAMAVNLGILPAKTLAPSVRTQGSAVAPLRTPLPGRTSLPGRT